MGAEGAEEGEGGEKGERERESNQKEGKKNVDLLMLTHEVSCLTHAPCYDRNFSKPRKT